MSLDIAPLHLEQGVKDTIKARSHMVVSNVHARVPFRMLHGAPFRVARRFVEFGSHATFSTETEPEPGKHRHSVRHDLTFMSMLV